MRRIIVALVLLVALIILFTSSIHLITSTSSQETFCKLSSIQDQQLPQNKSDPPIKHSIYHIQQGTCENKHGRIAITQFVMDQKYIEGEVFNALQSMRCYAKMKGYHLYQFDFNGALVNNVDFDIKNAQAAFAKCKRFKQILTLRHCVSAEMLAYYNYVIHIDADSGVVNPHHCFEEYINPNVDMHFLLRIHTGEIQAGHYIMKSTEFSKQFLMKWANATGAGTDQPLLQELISKHFLPTGDHQKCANFKGKYWQWIICITSSLRAKKRTSGKLLLYSRAQTFVRDGWASNFRWSKQDFMFHAMKRQDDVAFTRKLRIEDCEHDVWVIPTKKELYIDSEKKMQNIWLDLDKKYFVPKQYAIDIGVAHCWPKCPHLIA